MSLVTLNGNTVLDFTLTLPLWGVWWAELDIDAESLATGPATLVVAGTTFNGTIREARAAAGRVKVRVYGGADKLRSVLEPLHYGPATPGGLPIQDMALALGESLADGVRAKLDQQVLQSFHRPMSPATRLLGSLARVLGDDYNWRVRGDGTLWMGRETWDSLGGKLPFQETPPDAQGMAVYAPDDGRLVPGVNLDGQRVFKVVYRMASGLRADVYFLKDATETRDRHRDDRVQAARNAIPELEWLEIREATVIEQSGDGLLDVSCSDPRIGDVTDLPLFVGLPGVKVEVQPGARVLVAFSEAAPDKGFAMLFGGGSKASKIVIDADEIELGGAGGRVLRDGDVVAGPWPSPTGPITLAPTNIMAGPPGAGWSKVKG